MAKNEKDKQTIVHMTQHGKLKIIETHIHFHFTIIFDL